MLRVSEFVVITGMSGAGRSTGADTFEDLGWFVIDNLPPALIPKVAELARRPGAETDRVVLVVGRGGSPSAAYVDELVPALDHLRASGTQVRILFLEASDEVLLRRYEATRRPHPQGIEGVLPSIAVERVRLSPVKATADVVVDTTDLNVHQLRDRLLDMFSIESAREGMRTSIMSFGFKHGPPSDADLVLDCRFLPNPHWVDNLRALTGLDQPVREYVLTQPMTGQFLNKLEDLLGMLLPAYVAEGKSYLTIALGCTGGHHRSVVIAEEIAEFLRGRGFQPAVHHRDIGR